MSTVPVPAGAQRETSRQFLLCAGAEGVENTHHSLPRAQVRDS